MIRTLVVAGLLLLAVLLPLAAMPVAIVAFAAPLLIASALLTPIIDARCAAPAPSIAPRAPPSR